jgi:hypothetical protein
MYENGLGSFPVTGFVTGNVESSGSAVEISLCTCVRTWREIQDCVPQMEV